MSLTVPGCQGRGGGGRRTARGGGARKLGCSVPSASEGVWAGVLIWIGFLVSRYELHLLPGLVVNSFYAMEHTVRPHTCQKYLSANPQLQSIVCKSSPPQTLCAKFMKYLKQNEIDKENQVEDDLGFEINFGAFQQTIKASVI